MKTYVTLEKSASLLPLQMSLEFRILKDPLLEHFKYIFVYNQNLSELLKGIQCFDAFLGWNSDSRTGLEI